MKVIRNLSKCISTSTKLYHQNPLGLPKSNPKLDKLKPNTITKRSIENVKSIIAISSGKGGVGKSTTTVNLAIALSKLNKRVGILDCDLFGPSIPLLMNLNSKAQLDSSGRLKPAYNYGIPCMSMGLLTDPNKAVAWRGMMVMKGLQQLFYSVVWPELDYLVVDMPPGTGDTQITIGQLLPLSGALIVSTPQDLALIDAKKGIDLFQKVDVKVLGLVQNMSYFICTKCSEKHYLFGKNKVVELADRINIPLLSELPICESLAECNDNGTPIVVSKPESATSKSYLELANKLIKTLE